MCLSSRFRFRAIRKKGRASTIGDTMRLVMNQNHKSFFPRNSNRASAKAAGTPRNRASKVVQIAMMSELMRVCSTPSSKSASR